LNPTTLRILYLDDNEQDRLQVRDILQQEPGAFKLTEAGSSGEFDVLLSSQTFDLVLCDVNIPDLSSLDVLEKVRALNMQLPVIILTGSQNGQLGVESIQHGAADLIIKSPASLGILSHKIGMVMDKIQADEKRLERERRYNDMIRRLPVGVYIVRAKPGLPVRFEYISPRCCEILGINEKEIMSDADQIYKAVHPEDRENFSRARKGVAAAGLPFSWEGRFIVGGRLRWVRIESEPMLLPDGDSIWNGVVVDITERMLAERLLSNSEALNQAIISESPIGIAVFSNTGEVLFGNNVWKKIWGFSEEEYQEELQRQFKDLEFDVWDVYLQDHHDQVRQVYAKGGSLYLPDLKIPHPRLGGAEWVSQYYYAILDEQDLVERIVTLTEDISARKKAEAEIIKSRTLLERVQEVAHLGSVEINLTAQTVVAGTQARRIYGWGDDDLTLSNVQSCVLPEYRSELDKAQEALIHLKQEFNLQYKIKRKSDGAIRDIHAIAEYNPDENTVVGSVQDITERKLIMQVLLENEEKFRTLFERANDMIVITDVNDRILDVNKRTCELTGYSRDELLKMKVTDLQAQEVRGSSGTVSKSEFKKFGSNVFESVDVRKDGTTFPVEVTLSRITIASGIRFFGIVRDVSERKRIEKDLKEQIDTLERNHAVTVDRELRMIELKKEINNLLLKAGKKEKYPIPEI